jgi:hypothetical protein
VPGKQAVSSKWKSGIQKIKDISFMIRLWGRRNAYNVQKVCWTLGELDLPYEPIEVGGEFGGLD